MDALAAHERDKYARMWARPEYSAWSPGTDSAAEAMELFGVPGPVIDFGCGQGLTLPLFAAHGFAATGVDHVTLRPGIVEECLWDLPDTLAPAPYGFCADVMEHIPPERVDDVLRGIAAKVTRLAYFRIATGPDGCGSLIGETLHLTVRTGAWWRCQIAAAFSRAALYRVAIGHAIVICGK